MNSLRIGMFAMLLSGACCGQERPIYDFSVKPPQVESLDVARQRAEPIRAMKKENEIRDQTIRMNEIKLNQMTLDAEKDTREPVKLPLLVQEPQTQKAQEPHTSEILSWGFLNGRGWRAASLESKVFYVLGVREALTVIEDHSERPKFFGTAMDNGDTETALDHFYTETENLLVPVFEAMKLVSLKVSGAPESEIDQKLSTIRKLSSNAPESEKAGKP